MPNKPANIDSSFPKLHKDKRNRFRFILHWFNIISVSFLMIWVVIGNLVAYQLEQPVLIAKNDLVGQFPRIEMTASGLKLKELIIKLGTTTMPATVRNDLSSYVQDSTTTPSNSLQNYLSAQSQNIKLIRSLLLKNVMPQWESFDLNMLLNEGAFDPRSFLEAPNLHRILIADEIIHYRTKESPAAFDSLEAAWKLNQSIREMPTLISQLVAIISDKIQLRWLRKIDLVPPIWQMRLLSPDIKKHFFMALKFEAFMKYGRLRNFPLRKGGSERDEKSSSILSRILQPFVQPYFTLSAVNKWQVEMRELELIFNQDPCAAIPFTDISQISSWNILGVISESRNYVQATKLFRRQIDMELTQKILRLREVASQTGKFPQTLSEIDSSVICKNLHYVYQPAPDGKMMTISVSPQNRPEWLVEREGNIPLTYTTKLQNL